jgi:16S rRNA (uracil1498-N3)-methyltransferase
MLGVAEVWPVLASRGDVPASAGRDGGRLERWRRIAVSAAKQCGRAAVPAVAPPATLAACLARDHSDLRLFLTEPEVEEPAADAGVLTRRGAIGSALLLVGPEGGWTFEELSQARGAGCVPLTLGRRTLRADAAPLVALSVLFYVLGEF